MFTQLPCRVMTFVCAAILLLGRVPAVPAMDWEIESFDSTLLWVGDTVAIAVGADGTPYIAHDVSLEGTIHFAFPGPDGWVVEAVDDYYSSGGGAAVALDASGMPCIAYGYGNPDFVPVVLTFARRTANGWEFSPVAEMHYDVRSALRFRSDGAAVLAFAGYESPHCLQYATQDDAGNWQITTADTATGSGWDISMVLDETDNPHICHWEWVVSNAHEEYLYQEGGTWYGHILDRVGGCNVMGSGIALDSEGNTHVAWETHVCQSPGALKYAKSSPSGWSTVTIHSGFSNYTAGCSLVVDRLGKPHVLYGTQGQLAGGPSQLRYAHLNDAGNWVHELVDGNGDCGEINAVAIDNLGFLHVAYYVGDGSSQYGVIRYARSTTSVAPPPLIGDLDCDGLLNAFDIDPFVLALTDASAYELAFPACDYMLADINGDGAVNSFDIDPFVVLLTGK